MFVLVVVKIVVLEVVEIVLICDWSICRSMSCRGEGKDSCVVYPETLTTLKYSQLYRTPLQFWMH